MYVHICKYVYMYEPVLVLFFPPVCIFKYMCINEACKALAAIPLLVFQTDILCVYIYLCVYICIYVNRLVHIHTDMYISIYLCMYVCICMNTDVYIYMFIFQQGV